MAKNILSIRHLLESCHVAYHYQKINHKKDMNPTRKKSLIKVEKLGYQIDPELNTHTQVIQSNLGAVVLVNPRNKEKPVVIAFRGTSDLRDIRTDMNLTLTGTAGKTYLAEAYQLYQEAKRKYPHQEIILTGHSLGGHIAQYVGARALLDKKTSPSLLTVKTFNTAAISKKYAAQIERDPTLNSRFMNFRLSNDIVSKDRNIGDTFSFYSPTGKISSHLVATLKEQLPKPLLSLPASANHPLLGLKLKIIGIKESYQCRINGQVFSNFRIGAKKNKLLQTSLNKILSYIDKHQGNPEIIFKFAQQEILRLEHGIQQFRSGKKASELVNGLKIVVESIQPMSLDPQTLMQKSLRIAQKRITQPERLKIKLGQLKATQSKAMKPKNLQPPENNPPKDLKALDKEIKSPPQESPEINPAPITRP